MISPKDFYNYLTDKGVGFYSGVPDSLLKDICAYITDNTTIEQHIIAANEGNAVALASGYHLATGKIPMVYMQNSGLGNAVNPLLSLADKKVYSIPMLVMIGWRGEPGVKDEPQHISQGEVSEDMLKAMRIPYCVLSMDSDEAKMQLSKALSMAEGEQMPYAILIKKGTFEKYKIKQQAENSYEMMREEAIKAIVAKLSGKEIIVSTTGKTSRELFECRAALNQPHHSDFLTVGSMGHANQIALGIALNKPDKRILCIDGDGALLMHMGSLAINGTLSPKNFIHIAINNGAHESVGGQPTVGFGVDLCKIALANNYKSAHRVKTALELTEVLSNIGSIEGPVFIEIMVKQGSRDDLGRPTIKPVDNKTNFMKQVMS